MDLDHLAGLAELGLEVLGPALQPGDLLVTGISRLATGAATQGLFGALVTLASPLGEQRRVEALSAQEGTLLGLGQVLVLGEDPGLVGGGEPSWSPGSLRDLGVRIGVVRHCAIVA